MDEKFRKLECYINMTKQEQKNFEEIADDYSYFLGNGKTENATDIRLTLHDFEHHCYNIFVYISKVIVADNWGVSKHFLLSRELYILNLAVLFHDISLHMVQGCERKKHASLSAKWVEEEYKNTSSAFSDKCGMTETEVDALCAVIKAHSDEEGGKGIEPDNEELNRDYPANAGEYIRVRLLAGILRLADELDITEMRIGDRRFEDQLRRCSEEYLKAKIQFDSSTDSVIKNSAEQEMQRLAPDAESYKHWKKLHCFEEVVRDDTNIVLKVKKKWLSQEISARGEEAVGGIIEDVYLKVSKEFFRIQKYLFDRIKQIRTIIAVDKVVINGVDSQLQNRLERKYQNLKHEFEEETLATEEKYAIQLGGTSELEEGICRWIEQKNLLTAGHYIMNEKYCACDWIDTMAVIGNREIYCSCVNLYIRHIRSLVARNTLLIGLDLQGAIIASTVGFVMGMPFTYIIPVHKKAQNSEMDSKFDSSAEKDVILFTDAIVTTQSIDDACDRYGIQQQFVKAVYSIFYRPIRKGTKIETVAEKYKNKIFYINDKYETDLISRDACKRNDFDKCLAFNKQVDLGGNAL